MSQIEPLNSLSSTNPLLKLNYEPALEVLGNDFYDVVSAAEFPQQILRFRNHDVLHQIGLDPNSVSDADFMEAFGKFQGREPFLALRYHGYQFGEYNAFLGDGRGFLYGQVRGVDGELYDFGTKGSGTTPYSRGGDGRLTLKGGVREVLASEMLHRLGVRSSRCLSLIETGEALWRGDEPSPTRSSVMIRFSRSHIRFGTFERLSYLKRKDLITILLDHVIEIYYPHLIREGDRYRLFYAELVQRVAKLVSQWMSAGFCHAVLNTDNMSITGESFDYGPYAFIDTYNPQFTAAYFDYFGRYCYGNQPAIGKWNLEMLQVPLKQVIPLAEMESSLAKFEGYYEQAYQQEMLKRLGFEQLEGSLAKELVNLTITFLKESQISYQGFFWEITEQFSRSWRSHSENILHEFDFLDDDLKICFQSWQQKYHQALNSLPESALLEIANRLSQSNSNVNLIRPTIESIWEPITQADNWTPFYTLLEQIQAQPAPKTSI
jgi:serine/tyrosine/threonine adenylyltransferase